MDWIPLLTGFVGALLGSLTSIITLIIQNASQNRREIQRLIFDTAYKDYELRFRYATEQTPQRASFPIILAYHKEMIELMEKGRLTPASAKEILDSQVQMAEALQQAVNDIDTKEDKRMGRSH